MNRILRNVLAVVCGIVLGSMVNIGLVELGHSIVSPPDGVDLSTTEGLRNAMALFGPEHFIFPFLAHALGTLSGAFIAAMIAASNRMRIALGVGLFFLIGGIAMVVMLPSPIWFTVLDLLFAYMPMAIVGGRAAISRRGNR